MDQTNTVNNTQYTDVRNINVVDEYNKFDYKVDGAEYDYVSSFFKKSIPNSDLAKNFTTAIYQVAIFSNTPVVDLIKSLDGQSDLEISISMAYYLNGIRSNSALLGVQNLITPNYHAQRSVLI